MTSWAENVTVRAEFMTLETGGMASWERAVPLSHGNGDPIGGDRDPKNGGHDPVPGVPGWWR